MKKLFLTTFTGLFLTLPLFAYAHTTGTAHEEGATSTTQVVQYYYEEEEESSPSKIFTLCSQDAIEKRDTSIALSRSDYNIAMNNALLERKNSEKSAVGNDGDTSKKAALKSSVENYKNKAKTAQQTLTQARKAAWQTFENDLKKCRDDRKEIEGESETKEMVQTFSNSTSSKQEDKELREHKEAKTIKETFRAQLESFKSLFN